MPEHHYQSTVVLVRYEDLPFLFTFSLFIGRSGGLPRYTSGDQRTASRSWFSPPTFESGRTTQVGRLGSKCLCPLSHLAAPKCPFSLECLVFMRVIRSNSLPFIELLESASHYLIPVPMTGRFQQMAAFRRHVRPFSPVRQSSCFRLVACHQVFRWSKENKNSAVLIDSVGIQTCSVKLV